MEVHTSEIEHNKALVWTFPLLNYMLYSFYCAYFVKIAILECTPTIWKLVYLSATNQDMKNILVLTDILHFVEYNIELVWTFSLNLTQISWKFVFWDEPPPCSN